MDLHLLCFLVLTELFPVSASLSYVDKMGEQYTERLGVCVAVAMAAEQQQVRPSWAVSVAMEESRMTSPVSSAGARGPLQVIPRWGCDKGKAKGCDFVRAGLVVMRKWMAMFPKPREWLCHYGSGNNCTKASKAYADRVIKRQHRLSAMLSSISPDLAGL